MGKRKLGIKTLGYPLWFNIVFYLLTVIAPVVLIVLEGLDAPDTKTGLAFKATFMVLATAVVVWTFIKKWIIGRIETKLVAKQTLLEHDYSIDNGNPTKIKYLWYSNELKLVLFNIVTVAIHGGLLSIVLIAVAHKLMDIVGAVFIIAALYIIAYTLKLVLILTTRKVDEDEE